MRYGLFSAGSVNQRLDQQRGRRGQVNAVIIHNVDFVTSGLRKAAGAPVFHDNHLLFAKAVPDGFAVVMLFLNLYFGVVIAFRMSFDRFAGHRCDRHHSHYCGSQDENSCASFYESLHWVHPFGSVQFERFGCGFPSLKL